jgi:hypothetical protein
MKIGSRLLAILALGALSTHVAVAGYHGHRASVGTAASHSGTDARSLVKAPVAGSRQGFGPALKSDAADHANSGVVKDGSPIRTRGTRTKPPRKLTPSRRPHRPQPADFNAPRRLRPAPKANRVRQGSRSTPASPSIRAVKPSRAKTVGSIKTRPPLHRGSGLKHKPVRNLHMGSLVGTEAGPQRNAIGAVVEHDKTVANGNGTVGGVAAPSTNVALQRAGAVLHQPDNKIVSGNTSVKTQSAGTTELGNHASPTAAALRVVSSNGLSTSGTGIIRPGLGVGALGGPAKNGASGLSGSSFRPRRPCRPPPAATADDLLQWAARYLA